MVYYMVSYNLHNISFPFNRDSPAILNINGLLGVSIAVLCKSANRLLYYPYSNTGLNILKTAY